MGASTPNALNSSQVKSLSVGWPIMGSKVLRRVAKEACISVVFIVEIRLNRAVKAQAVGECQQEERTKLEVYMSSYTCNITLVV